MSVKKNVIANYIGRFLLILLSIIFIPLYIQYIGIESYGLLGIYTMLVSMMMLVDVGMGQTIIREVARYSSATLSDKEILDTLQTFRYIYFFIGLFAFLGIYFLSETIVLRWLNIEHLSFDIVVSSLEIMSLMLFINWLSILYRNAIIGLQYQVWLNVVDVTFALLSKVGVIFILLYISSSIVDFLLYQLCISFLQLLTLAFKLNNIFSKIKYQSSFSLAVFHRLWKFASGVAITTLFGTLISQADRLVLSSLLSLKTFGLYTMASVIGKALSSLISPLTLAIRPKLTILYEKNNEVELISFYHKSAQLMSIISMPIAMILILFSRELLWIWTDDMHLVNEIYIVVSLLVTGSLLNGMMHIPYSLQLSAGWSSLSAKSNVILFFSIIPLLIYAVNRYGMVAAPLLWVLVNLIYIVLIIHIMHKKLLKTEKWYWYKYDIIYILLASSLLGILSRILIDFSEESKILILGEIMIAYCIVAVGAVLSANKYRDIFITYVFRRKKYA